MKMHNMERASAGWIKGFTVLTMVMALTACGITDRASKRVDDTWAGDMLFGDKEKVILTSDGGNQLNPDDSGRPLSVVLRVYQLTALERFASTDADSLWDDPQRALGNTLIDSQEITLLPGMGQNNQWPLNKATGYVGVAAFFCFMFSWVEMLLSKTLTAVEAKPIAAVMTRTASSAGYELGLLAAAGTLTIIPGAIVIYFVRNYIAKGFALGRV